MERDGTLHIQDPEAARLLTDPRERQVLAPFMRGEVSLAEAARELGLKLTTLHYRVRRLIQLGLLEVTREVPRKGRPIKLYRATAQEFAVPFSATPEATIEEFLLERGRYLLEVFMRNFARVRLEQADEWLFRITFDTEKGLLMQVTSPLASAPLSPSAPAAWLSDFYVRLDFEAAKALQHELAELHERYFRSPPGSGGRYYLILGLVPLEDPE